MPLRMTTGHHNVNENLLSKWIISEANIWWHAC